MTPYTTHTALPRAPEPTAALPATLSVAQWDQDARGDDLALAAYGVTLRRYVDDAHWGAHGPSIFYALDWHAGRLTVEDTLEAAVRAIVRADPARSQRLTAKTLRGRLVLRCPACNETKSRTPRRGACGWLRVCLHCGCHYGRTTLTASERVAHGPMAAEEPELDARVVPYDFLYRDEQGVLARRHGWFDPETGRITQTG